VLLMAGFAEFGPQNSVATIPKGIGGSTWHHNGGCFKVKQLCVEHVAVRSKNLVVGLFRPYRSG
jgi:hypothetical protein